MPPLPSQHPQVAPLRDRLVRGLGHIVGIGQAGLDARLAGQEPSQVVGVESQRRPVDAGALELGDLDRQQVQVPGRQLARLVVGDAVGTDLFGAQVAGHVDGHLLQVQVPGRLPARVPADDHAVAIDDDRHAEAELADRLSDRLHGVVVLAWVLFVWCDLLDRTVLNFHGFVLLDELCLE